LIVCKVSLQQQPCLSLKQSPACHALQDECNKYGAVIKLTIPRPSADNASPNGLGLVIIEYADVNAALKAKQAMHGRKFGGHVVEGTFLQEHDYMAGNFSASQ
jgi:splicing factor U2AF subunit